MNLEAMATHSQEAALLKGILVELQAIRGLLEAGQRVPGPPPSEAPAAATVPVRAKRTRRAKA